MLVSAKRKSAVVPQCFIPDVAETYKKKVATDFVTRRYVTGALFMHPDVPLERPGAAALFRLPSAAGTSHLRSSKSSYQNKSLLL